LEKIGEILHLAKSGRLIVKVDEQISHKLIGQALVDDKGIKIGKIIELIGSVKSPYASVIPSVDSKYSVGGKVFSSNARNQQFNSSRKRGRMKRRRKM
jgi:rRNA processing protein Gar1